MLTIEIPATEIYNPLTNTFYEIKPQKLVLEHSLVSISKWEAKWKKAFLTEKERTKEELVDYIRCMTLTQNVEPIVYYGLTEKNFREVQDYMDDPMTATTFRKEPSSPNREIFTSELIYFLMITYKIPPEFQKWHINRLLTLIEVCDRKSRPAKKMSKNDTIRSYKELNEARRKATNSRG